MLIVHEKCLLLALLLIFDDSLGRFGPGLRPFLPFIGRPQAERPDEAIRSDISAAVPAQAEAMLRAWNALDAAAITGGWKPLAPTIWEAVLPETGEVVAIVRDADEAFALGHERKGAIWTLAEVAIARRTFGDTVRAAKEAFPGADVTTVRHHDPSHPRIRTPIPEPALGLDPRDNAHSTRACGTRNRRSPRILGSSRPSTYAGGGSAILCYGQVREPGSHPALEVRGFALGFAPE
jgi:hypothetical protein